MNRQEFLKPSSAPTAKPVKTRRADQPDVAPLKILLFGPWGSGKTYSIKGLLEAGLKVHVLNTDLGGSGLRSVIAPLRKSRPELLERLWETELEGYDQVISFLENPASLDPDFWKRDPDVLFWDGFSTWQQSDVSVHIGSEAPENASDLRLEGLKLETMDWVGVKNATVKALRRFFAISREGRPLHKIVTCLEAIRLKPKPSKSPDVPSEFVEERRPMLSGQGGVIAGAGFDLIIRVAVEGQKHLYQIAATQDRYSKNRGFDLPPVMDADMRALWEKISSA